MTPPFDSLMPTSEPAPRSRRPARWIWAAVMLGATALGAVAAVAWFGWGRGGATGAAAAPAGKPVASVARAHVPEGCEALLVVDVGRALAHPAFRAEVVLRLGAADGGTASAGPGP